MLLSATMAQAAQWDKTRLLGTTQINNIDTETQAQHAALDRLLANYREGMKLTYSSGSTLAVSAGEVMVSDSTGATRLMMQTTSSTNVTFSDLDTGSEAPSTTYYVYAIAASASDTTATFKISTSATSPSGVTYYKYLGQFYNNSSSDMEQIKNDNDNTIVSTGTASNSSTIALPSGFSNDECDVTVSANSQDCFTNSGGIISDVEATYSVNSSRVVTATCHVRDNNGTATSDISNTVNYIVVCHK